MVFGSTILSAIRAIPAVLGGLWQSSRRLRAERAAGRDPTVSSNDAIDKLLNDALGRLGAISPSDPKWKSFAYMAGGVVTRPEDFDKPAIREWLSNVTVKAALIRLSRQRLVGGPDQDAALSELYETYMANTGEGPQYAKSRVETVVAMLKASIESSSSDTGGLAVSQAGFKDVQNAIRSLRQDIVKPAEIDSDGVIAAHHYQDAVGDLDIILRSRGTPWAETLPSLSLLMQHLGPAGKYRGTPASVRADVLFWIARLSAGQGVVAAAEQSLQELRDLAPDYDTTIANAWLDVAKGDVDSALRLLRDRSDADSRSNLFTILATKKSKQRALEWFDRQESHASDQFTGPGWRNVVGALLDEGRLDAAANLLNALPASLVESCPILALVSGVVNAAHTVAPTFRHRVIVGNFLDVADHLLTGPEMDSKRQQAHQSFTIALALARELEDRTLEIHAVHWMRWLRLTDPATRDDEAVLIREEMTDPAKAVDAVQFAEAFGISFDGLPLETFLQRQESIGGLNPPDLAAKLSLLRATDRHAELAEFIESHHGALISSWSAGALTGALIDALSRSGQCSRAEEVLNSHKQELHPEDLPRFALMIADCKGEDPTVQARENFERTGALIDLQNLVRGLGRLRRFVELTPFALQLFEKDPTGENARRYVTCLQATDAPLEKLLGFLERCSALSEADLDLASSRAWAFFHAGELDESRRINERLLKARRDVSDVGLEMNLALRSGEWERFAGILDREWEHRDELPTNLALNLARLVSGAAPDRARQLLDEAVSRNPENPTILLQASGIALALGRDEIAIPQIHRAVQLSREDGPARSVPFREAIEFLKEQSESWKVKNDLYRSGKVPLHWAAGMFNVALSHLLIAKARQNADEPDARNRLPIPVRSGARMPVDVSSAKSIVLDVTTQLILSELGLLQDAIGAFDVTFVSPHVMEFILHEMDKVRFHQPSRIRRAKPLLDLVHSQAIKPLRVMASLPESLVQEIGAESAQLLLAAKREGGRWIDGGKLYKVNSYMDQEADLGEDSWVRLGPNSIARTLHDEAILDSTTFDEVRRQLSQLSGIGDEQTEVIKKGCPVFLDKLAAEWLSDVNVLGSLTKSGRNVHVHPDTIREWEALVGTERFGQELTASLERIRSTLKQGIQSRRVQLLNEGPREAEDDPHSGPSSVPVFDLLEDGARADAVCIDDRFFNANAFLDDRRGRRAKLVCVLDVLDVLVGKRIVDHARRLAAIHSMRRWCYFTIPLDPLELLAMVKDREADVDGHMRESAELRVIRENIARLHASNFLTKADLAYLDQLWQTGVAAIRTLWSSTDEPIESTRLKADWIFDYVIPDVEVALRSGDFRDEQVRSVAVARLAMFLTLGGIPEGRREAWHAWLEQKVIDQYLPANSVILDQTSTRVAAWLIEHSKGAADEVRRSSRPHGPSVSAGDHC
ncbi:MAG: hypothetical protein HYR63_29635 [Proteobacteria bacterium]|nr:hypothetical protein [Pseudomonadota bacterium]